MNKPYTPLPFTPRVVQALTHSDYHIIVTGAGGWLGQATLEMLGECLGEVFSQRVTAFTSSPRPLSLRSGQTLQANALKDISTLTPRPCLIFHYAFLTRDRVAQMPLAEFVERNEAISSVVFDAARRCGAAGIFVPSSGAIYGPERQVDDNLEKNPYGVMKARDEQRFSALGDAMRIVIMRVFNLGGPFINKLGSYALSSILGDLLQGRPITLQAERPVVRSYIHVRDVIDLAMAMLLSHEPPPSTPFDTAGEREIEIGELATLAAGLCGKPDWPVHRPPVKGEANRYVGDSATIRALMKTQHIDAFDLGRQITDTAEYLSRGN